MGARAVVGLGANLGDRLAQIREAACRIGERHRIVRASSVYECDAVGPPQPRYLNAAILLEPEVGPEALLGELLDIERELGRERLERWGPRVIDLDILVFDELRIDEPRLTVPHPRLTERTFALTPLIEVAPAATVPGTGRPYAEWLSRVLEPKLTRMAFPDDWCPLRTARNHE